MPEASLPIHPVIPPAVAPLVCVSSNEIAESNLIQPPAIPRAVAESLSPSTVADRVPNALHGAPL